MYLHRSAAYKLNTSAHSVNHCLKLGVGIFKPITINHRADDIRNSSVYNLICIKRFAWKKKIQNK